MQGKEISSRLIVFVARLLPSSFLEISVKSGDGRSVTGSLARRILAPLRTSDVSIPHGMAAGVRFNAGGSAPSFSLGTTEPEVQAALRRLLRPGDIFYDIGANVGFYTVLASRLVGSDGHVYAFEPVPDNVRAIEHNLELAHADNVSVFPYAVADTSGRLTVTLSQEPFWPRLSTLPPPPHPTGNIEVTGISVDDLVREKLIMPPNVVKMDVEGAERLALAGMRETMIAFGPTLLCELHDTYSEVCPILLAANYQARFLWRRVRGRNQRSRHIIAYPIT